MNPMKLKVAVLYVLLELQFSKIDTSLHNKF